MRWKTNSGNIVDQNSATSAEEDITLALIFADNVGTTKALVPDSNTPGNTVSWEKGSMQIGNPAQMNIQKPSINNIRQSIQNIKIAP